MAQSWNEFIRMQREALSAFVAGDAEPYRALWSREADVSIFGAFGGREVGWADVGARLRWAAGHSGPDWVFSDETLAEVVGADIGVRVSFERNRSRDARGGELLRERRVTHVARLEAGHWHIVHLHADPLVEKRAP
jgi:hypothetical protein